MSRYATSVPTRAKAEDDTPSVPKPPATCGVLDCHGHTDVLTVIVLDNGREKAGAFCDFGFTRAGDQGPVLKLRQGATFVGWVARCGYHHLRDLYRSEKGRWSDMARTDRLSLDDVAAYVPNPAWDRIGTQPDRRPASAPTHVGAVLAQTQESAV